MSVEGHKFYPGEVATAAEILQLADEYRIASEALLPIGRRGAPLSRAPYRLVAIQAIELYLNALLLDAGLSASDLRGLQHDLAERARLAAKTKLVLRRNTQKHLKTLSETREYLIIRYDPAQSAVSHPNRLKATLTEIGNKVGLIVRSVDAS